MRDDVAMGERAYVEREVPLDFEVLIEELAGALQRLIPDVKIGNPIDDCRHFSRGTACAELSRQDAVTAAITLWQRNDAVLFGCVPITAKGLNDLAADLVGFLCGAPLVTLAICPRRADAVVVGAPARPRRRDPYNVPLIAVPAARHSPRHAGELELQTA
jgi:hypothetical protein